MIAYFTGVRPGDRCGHFCYSPGWTRASDGPATPWTMTGGWSRLPEMSIIPEARAAFGLSPLQTGGPEPEGDPRLLHRDGWTLLCLWDRSADNRGGCCATWAFDEVLTLDEALLLARALFPGILERIEIHIGRPLGEPGRMSTEDLVRAVRAGRPGPIVEELCRRVMEVAP